MGEGSTFEILFPAQEPAAAPAATLEMPIPTGSESILFVDDETMIVDIVQRMLESLGYRVTAKTSAMEALDVFKTDPDSFDLVVTDMTMPKMTGLDLAEKIFQIRPGFPIVLCTGFDVTMNEEKITEHGLRDIIYKPILRRNMATVIRKVLDSCKSTKADN
jgi:CheY-like chemotaxis protein